MKQHHGVISVWMVSAVTALCLYRKGCHLDSVPLPDGLLLRLSRQTVREEDVVPQVCWRPTVQLPQVQDLPERLAQRWVPFTLVFEPFYGAGVLFTSGLNHLRLSYLIGKFHNIGDQSGFGEDHCQFVDSFLDGRTGRQLRADQQPSRLGKHLVSCAPGRCLKMFSQLQ